MRTLLVLVALFVLTFVSVHGEDFAPRLSTHPDSVRSFDEMTKCCLSYSALLDNRNPDVPSDKRYGQGVCEIGIPGWCRGPEGRAVGFDCFVYASCIFRSSEDTILYNPHCEYPEAPSPYLDPSRIYLSNGGSDILLWTLRQEVMPSRKPRWAYTECSDDGQCVTITEGDFFVDGVGMEGLLTACTEPDDTTWTMSIDFDTRDDQLGTRDEECGAGGGEGEGRTLDYAPSETDACVDPYDPQYRTDPACLRDVQIIPGSCMAEPECEGGCGPGVCMTSPGMGGDAFSMWGGVGGEFKRRHLKQRDGEGLFFEIFPDLQVEAICVCPPDFTGPHCEYGTHRCDSTGDPHITTDFPNPNCEGTRWFDFHENRWYWLTNCQDIDLAIRAFAEPWVYSWSVVSPPHVNREMEFRSGNQMYRMAGDVSSGCDGDIRLYDPTGAEVILNPIQLLEGDGTATGRVWACTRFSPRNIECSSEGATLAVRGWCSHQPTVQQLVLDIGIRVSVDPDSPAVDLTLCTGVCTEYEGTCVGGGGEGGDKKRSASDVQAEFMDLCGTVVDPVVSCEDMYATCYGGILTSCDTCGHIDPNTNEPFLSQLRHCLYDVLEGLTGTEWGSLKKRQEPRDPPVLDPAAIANVLGGSVSSAGSGMKGGGSPLGTPCVEVGTNNVVGTRDPITGLCECPAPEYVPTADGLNCEKAGQGEGDPHFIGFYGGQYDVMGEPGKVFNIFSDKKMQVNARFVSYPESTETYMGEVAVRMDNECRAYMDTSGMAIMDPMTRVKIEKGERNVFPNGAWAEYIGQRVSVHHDGWVVHITRMMTPDGGNVHLDVLLDSETGDLPTAASPHGLLGQTARHPGVRSVSNGLQGEGVIEGHWSDYIIASDDIFDTENKYSMFE